MFNREIPSAASHSGHDFVGDEQNTVPAAHVGDTLQVSGRRRYGSESRAAHRLEDEPGRFAIRLLDRAFKLCGILLPAVAASIGAVVVASIAVWNPHMLALAHHWEID